MRACVFGCAGEALDNAERRFLREADPFGFILFARNCRAPGQVRRLVAELREAAGRRAPVLIDQEGGRVRRLRPPAWRDAPAPAAFGAVYARDPGAARRLARLNARLVADELFDLGIDVNCAPLLDLREPDGHKAIGDRAFSDDPAAVAALGRAWIEGSRAGGALPVAKHLPGHGRARVDSHLDLPTVDAPLEALERRDFAPFRALAGGPAGAGAAGMTGHVVFCAIDPHRPATLSPAVVGEVVRGRIGFDGLLFTDDLSMAALSGPVGARAKAALDAGCDIALHCNGDMAEMEEVAAAVPALEGAAAARAGAALADIEGLRAARRDPGPDETAAAFDRLLAGAA